MLMNWAVADTARLFEIAGVNIVLSGDNAVVVAMAIRNLPVAQRRIASAAGITGALLVETAVTLTIASLLEHPVLSLAGGLLLGWIAIRLLHENGSSQDSAIATDEPRGKRLHHSILAVAGAYLIMCLDNILAIAAVGRGHPDLLVLGLLLSAVLLVPASLMIANLMKRYRITVMIGAGLLGWTAGSMIAVMPSRLDEMLHGSINQLFIPAAMAMVVVTSPLWWRCTGKDIPGQ